MLSNPVDQLWLLSASGLVLLTQAGFICLYSGSTRSKDSVSVALKNLASLSLSILLYGSFGFGLMFGPTCYGLWGTSAPTANEGSTLFLLLHALLCATASTIISGAVAHRLRLWAYLGAAGFVSGFVCPLLGHWCWGGTLGGGDGWLASLGFVDFAGAGVVHVVGGAAALATILVTGQRTRRFDAKEDPTTFASSSLPIALLGAVLLLAGWLGVVGGRVLAFDEQVPGVLLNSVLAASAGVFTALALTAIESPKIVDPYRPIIGLLSGLVGISAFAHAASPTSAAVVGALASVAACFAQSTLRRMRIDGPVGAIGVHAVGGAVGLISVAIFGDQLALDTGLGRPDQLGVQFLGTLVLAGVSFGSTLGFLQLLSRIVTLRPTESEERVGLDLTEHGVESEVQAACRTLDEAWREQARQGLTPDNERVLTRDETVSAVGDGQELTSAYSSLLEKVAEQSKIAAYSRSQVEKAKQVEHESSFAHSVLNALNAAVCLVDTRGIIVAQNSRWRKLRCFGADKAAPGPGEEVADALANAGRGRGNNLAALVEPFNAFLQGQTGPYSAVHVARVGDETRWFDVTISEVDSTAVGRAAVLSLYDVSERIEAERAAVTAKTHADILTDAFESSQRMLAGTMNAAGIVTWQWDTETGHVQYGDHWADLAGDDRNRIDSNLSELVDRAHPEDREALQHHFLSRIDSDSETQIHCEFRLRRVTGEYHWMRVKGRVIQRREAGVPLVFAGIIDDIDEKKQAELRSAALSTIIEEASSEMLLFSAGTLQVINANRGARENLGYDLESLQKMSAHQILDTDSHETLLNALANETQSGAHGTAFNGSFVRRDGSAYALAGQLQRTQYLGEPAIAVHGIDITEKEQLEKQLAQSQKLESIGQLAAGVAHEINTPMQFISSNVDYLRRSMPKVTGLLEDIREMLGDGDLPRSEKKRVDAFDDLLATSGYTSLAANVQGAIEDCVVGSGRVVEIVRAMKDFSHPGTKDKTFANPNQLIESSSIVCKTRWRYVAEVLLDLDPRVPEILCLPAELNQVFLNLLVNSVDAIAEHRGSEDPLGKIQVRTEWKQDHVLIEVADSGPGIPPEVAERIFDPFFTTKEVGKGTGQGLAISHDVVVEKHGGRLTVESEPGHGATFRMTLPAEPVAPDGASDVSPSTAAVV